MSKYYLAYGSNLNLEQMKNRYPDAIKVGSILLDGYELEFRTYLTIKENKNKQVPVGVFKISDHDEKRLDIYEGFPILYRKENLLVNINGKKVYALIYIMNENIRDITPPNNDYLKICLEGYLDFGFDKRYIFEALNNFHV